MNTALSEQAQRFLQFDTPRRLASIASNLIHVLRAAENGSETLPLRMLSDAKLYIQWTMPDCSPDAAIRLTQLSSLVDQWLAAWPKSLHQPEKRAEILKLCKQWHDELLNRSRLLVG